MISLYVFFCLLSTLNALSPGELEIASGSQSVLIQASLKGCSQNVLNKADLLAHEEMLQAATKLQVNFMGISWTLHDLCYRIRPPNNFNASVATIFTRFFDRILPCYIATPLDCFWEGSKVHGPYPPFHVAAEFRALLGSDVLPENMTWMNLNPAKIMLEVNHFLANPTMRSLFKDQIYTGVRSVQAWLDDLGVEKAYQNKPCLNAYDPQRPERCAGVLDYANSVTNGCFGIAREKMHWQSKEILEDVETENGQVIKAKFLRSTIYILSNDLIYDRHKTRLGGSWTAKTAEQLVTIWKSAFEKLVVDSPFNQNSTFRTWYFDAYNVNSNLSTTAYNRSAIVDGTFVLGPQAFSPLILPKQEIMNKEPMFQFYNLNTSTSTSTLQVNRTVFGCSDIEQTVQGTSGQIGSMYQNCLTLTSCTVLLLLRKFW